MSYEFGYEYPVSIHSFGDGVDLFLLVPISCAVIGVAWAGTLLTQASIAPHFVAGNVLLGLSLICASLISLVASVVRQVRNTFGETERWYWGWWVMLMGTILVVMGIYYLNSGDASVRTAPAIVLIGLGMICYSISSKVLVGLGAVCFTLFSIVSILEAGTSK